MAKLHRRSRRGPPGDMRVLQACRLSLEAETALPARGLPLIYSEPIHRIRRRSSTRPIRQIEASTVIAREHRLCRIRQ